MSSGQSRLFFWGFCILSGLASAGLEFGAKWITHEGTRSNVSNPLNIFYLLGCSFIFAALLSCIVAISQKAASQAPPPLGPTGLKTVLSLIVTAGCCYASTSLANLPPLGSTRNTFIDYALTPALVVIVGRIFGKSRSRTSYWDWLVMAGCVTACYLMFRGAEMKEACHMDNKSGRATLNLLLPSTGRVQLLLLGVLLSIFGAATAAINMQLTRTLTFSRSNHEILLIKLVPIGPVMLLLAWLLRPEHIHYDWRLYLVAITFGACLFILLWSLQCALKREELKQVAPYLFLVPIFTLLLNVFPFQKHPLTTISLDEWIGMFGIMLLLAFLNLPRFHKIRPSTAGTITPKPQPQVTSDAR